MVYSLFFAITCIYLYLISKSNWRGNLKHGICSPPKNEKEKNNGIGQNWKKIDNTFNFSTILVRKRILKVIKFNWKTEE